MDKEGILARSRRERVDEGAKNAENHGMKIGIVCFLAVLIFLMAFNFFTGQQNDALLAVFWAYVAAEAFPRYRFSKEKSLLVTTIAGGLLAVANLATYVISVVE